MTIIHDAITFPADGGAVIFAELGGFSCSVCAPRAMAQDEVEAFAKQELGEPIGGWEAIDKSKIGLGGSTPNPCTPALVFARGASSRCERTADEKMKEEPMHTKDILAAELTKAGLHEMAAKAATGYYHDFLSPLPLPEMKLAADLAAAGTSAALALRARHINGEFDASKEESDEWAKSEEGQTAFSHLIGKR